MARRLRVAFVTTQSDTDPDQDFIPANVFYPHEGVYTNGGGATSTTPHRNIIAAWANTAGDYAGANGLTQTSATAYASNVGTLVSGTATSLNVLQAVNEWLDGTYDNYGFMVRRTSASGIALFHSKEAVNTSFRPRLVLTTTGGTVTLGSTSDTYVSGSLTVVQSPQNLLLQADASRYILLYFDLSAVTDTVTAASLQLTPSSSATVTVGVYRTDMDQLMPDIEFESGLAYSYPNDVGLENDENVVFAEDFSSDEWSTGMGAAKDDLMEDKGWFTTQHHFTPWEERPSGQIQEGDEHNLTVIGDTDPDDPNFVPLAPGRQCVKTRMGIESVNANDFPPFRRLNNFLSQTWFFYGNLGPIWEEYNAARGALLDEDGTHYPEEPEEIYTRMYFRLGHWNSRSVNYNSAGTAIISPGGGGGKWPNGVLATYDSSLTGNGSVVPAPSGGPYPLRKPNAPPRGGNGGFRSFTCAGWSFRQSFAGAPVSDPAYWPEADDTPLQEAGYRRIFGEPEDWSSVEEGFPDSNTLSLNYLGLIKEDTWHCHEVRVKMNTIDTTGATIAFVGYPWGGLYSTAAGTGPDGGNVSGVPVPGAIAHSGVCPSTGTTSTIVLASTASAVTNFYNNYAVRISSRPTEVRRITAYNATTKVATITSHKDADGVVSDTTWTNIPQSGETYQLIQNTSVQERTTLFYGTNRGHIYADEDAVLWGNGTGIPAALRDTEILESPGIGRKDGIRQIWIDGRLAASETDIWFRSIPNVQIEGLWYVGFMGGSGPIPQDESWMYFSEIVCSKSYIGPMRTT
jgi:hypothetical protein